MKTIRNVIVVIAVAAAQWCVTAATVEVATVAELTNAVARANAGEKIDGEAIDTIMLKSGIYAPSADEFMLDDGSVISFLNVQVENLTITGEDESPRKMWTSGSEPVVIDMGNIGRFVQHTKGGLMVKNIAVTGSRIASGYGTIATTATQSQTPNIFTNCVFRQNAGTQAAFWAHYYRLYDCTYVANSCMLNGYLRGCDISDNTSRIEYIHQMHDCTVSGQSLASSSALVGLSTTDLDTIVSNCTFRANKNNGGIFQLTQSAKIADCVFENNTNTLILATLDDTKSVLVSNCTFTANVTASTSYSYAGGGLYYGLLINNATNGFASAAAAQAQFSIVDSTFSGSSSTQGRGMAEVFGVTARGCKFRPQTFLYTDWNALNLAAIVSRLEECDINGSATAYSSIDRCTVHDVPAGAYACFRDYCRVTNTLVTNAAAHIYGSVYQHDAEFVNCTFATNSGLTYIAGNIRDSAPRNDVEFRNCIYNSNVRSGVASDISIGNDNNSLACWTDHVTFDSSYYGKFTASGKLTAEVFAAKTNGVDTLSLCVDPKFVKDSRPDAPYWSLLPKSPLIGKGDASIWTAEDVDLVGKLRLKDGKVDPGCYQCWINPPGMAIFVR
ncbi:MAG: right-handed parallel beta-helix repeat-containing protein [Kiritimatiellae bacterium]|nr:right-handed parallel beta-helix repeat-containing protein [Kiritimatiellia bacterium]